MNDLTVVFYSANQISDYFMANTQKHLAVATKGLPIVSVTHKPMDLGTNIISPDKTQSTFNLYQQVLLGAKNAKTKYIALAEDDVLYPKEHFNTRLPSKGRFLFNMNKWSIYTWTEPQIFSYKTNRRVLHQMSCERDLLIECLEERFDKYMTPESLNPKYFGEPGKYEGPGRLGVTERETEEWASTVPCVPFKHPEACGYRFTRRSHGTREAHGSLQKTELPHWGKAEAIIKLWQ